MSRTYIPHLIVIGSYGSNSGKTTLACEILSAFQLKAHWVGIKITTIVKGRGCPRGHGGCGVCGSVVGDFEIIKETSTVEQSDTSLLLAGGCRDVYWLRGQSPQLIAGFNTILTKHRESWFICESNSIIPYIKPAYHIMIKDEITAKKSAKLAEPYADITIRARSAHDRRTVIHNLSTIVS